MGRFSLFVVAAAALQQALAFSIPTPSSVPPTPEAADRRSFLIAGGLLPFSLAALDLQPAVAADGALDYKAVSQDIAQLLKKNPDWGPTLVRLAWHSSGTYDAMSKTGGSGGGTIRFKEELVHGGNAGLASTAVKWLEPIHKKYAKAGLSYADLYTLGGGTFLAKGCFPIGVLRVSSNLESHHIIRCYSPIPQ